MEVLRHGEHETVGPQKEPLRAADQQGAADAPAGEQEVETPDEEEDVTMNGEDSTSIMFIVPNEHDRIKGLYRRYRDPTDSPRERQLLAYQLLRELTVHVLAEEAVLYPVVAERVEEHMRDHAMDEHDSLKLFTSDLESMRVEDEGYEETFEAKMHQLMETFLEHIHEEEHRMLPALREALTEEELLELGKSFEAARQHLPTRPHPTDPKHPTHVDDATVLLDAARDAAVFGGTPPAIGSPSTEVLREGKGTTPA